jgi:uncharacterized membrane protein YqiK
MDLMTFAVAAGILAFIVFGGAMMVMKFYRKVEQGKALIVNTMKSEPEVTFTGKVVIPIIHKAETMDISVKTIEIDRRGNEGLICQDNIRADIKVMFFVRVNKTQEDCVKVAQAIGCVRASDRETLDELFSAKFSEALKTVGKQLDFIDLYTQREAFRDQIVQIIGRDLNGYILEDAAIDYLEQTPIEHLDNKNILDAQGIRKITQLTAIEHVKTNEFENDELKKITKQDVERIEAVLELERQKADAESKQQREIASVRAREGAETQKIQQEERLKSENARIKSDEEIAINEQNREREVSVAAKNKERVVAVENERVIKARDLEAVERERETELMRIDKEKALETERREIANVIRERIAVDKTVAVEEEAIKSIRIVEEANRTKDATVITAEAEAMEQLVKDVKAAEASEQAASHRARERVVLADAQLEAAERESAAQIKLANGATATRAAPGMAETQVKEANAVATEKMGHAEASALRERYLAEAEGLREKAQSMNSFEDATRDHEEVRLQIEKDKELGLEEIEARWKIAESQAELIQAGLKNAKIDIVGGESIFFDRLVGAIANGKAVDGFVDKSSHVSAAVDGYANGRSQLAADIKDVLMNPALSIDDLKNVTIAGALTQLMAGADRAGRAKLGQLLDRARSLGVDELQVG